MGMMNFEDTIKAFQCCTQMPFDCKNCPQQGPGFGFACRQDMRESVYHWLKVQEPHILSLQELCKLAYSGDDVAVYMEDMGDDESYNGWAEPDVNRNDEVRFWSFGNDCAWTPNNDNYGETWRCWTGIPSEEQRKMADKQHQEVKWND